MKSKHFRYSNHPLTETIDTAIDSRKAAGLPVTTGLSRRRSRDHSPGER